MQSLRPIAARAHVSRQAQCEIVGTVIGAQVRGTRSLGSSHIRYCKSKAALTKAHEPETRGASYAIAPDKRTVPQNL